jgi:hypothetical protein
MKFAPFVELLILSRLGKQIPRKAFVLTKIDSKHFNRQYLKTSFLTKGEKARLPYSAVQVEYR